MAPFVVVAMDGVVVVVSLFVAGSFVSLDDEFVLAPDDDEPPDDDDDAVELLAALFGDILLLLGPLVNGLSAVASSVLMFRLAVDEAEAVADLLGDMSSALIKLEFASTLIVS